MGKHRKSPCLVFFPRFGHVQQRNVKQLIYQMVKILYMWNLMFQSVADLVGEIPMKTIEVQRERDDE